MPTYASPTKNDAVYTSPNEDLQMRGLFDFGTFDAAVFDDSGYPAYSNPSKNDASYSTISQS